MRTVNSPRTYHQLAVINSGVQPGERVVVDGQIRVVPNRKVDVVRTIPVAPAPEQVALDRGARGTARRGSVTGLFIRRPIMTTLVMAAIVIFGIFAYRVLPVSDLPNVDFPTIQVTAALPGASPETMASSVATPLEKQFTTIAGVSQMTSTSQLGPDQHHHSVRSLAEPGRSGGGRAVGNCGGSGPVAAEHADAADLPQGEPGGSADPVPGVQLDDPADLPGGRRAAETTIGQRLRRLPGSRRSRSSGRPSTRYASMSIPISWPPPDRHRRGGAGDCRTATPTCRWAASMRATKAIRCSPTGNC